MGKADPWLAIGEPVDVQQPDQQAMATAPAAAPAAAPQAPPAEAFAAVGDPVDAAADPDAAAAVDHPTDRQWGDAPSNEAVTKLSPEQEAELVRITSTAPIDEAASLARRYAASQGFDLGDSIDKVVDYRRKTGHVADKFHYPLPKVLPQDGVSGAWGRGVADAIPFARDAGALADTAHDYLDGTQSDQGFGATFDRNTDLRRGVQQADEEHHPIARILGQLTAGLAIPMGAEGIAYKAGADALRGGATMAEARAIAAHAAKMQMAKSGAIYGTLHGAGEGVTPAERLGGAATEAVVGGAGGLAAGTVGEVLAPRFAARAAAARSAPLTEAQQTAAAAERQGIDLLPADVGGPVTRRATSMTAQTIAGGRPIKLAAENMTAQAKTARDRIAGAIGQAMDPEAAGEQAKSGAQSYMASSRSEARAFYAQAERASAGIKVATPKAQAVLDKNISDLAETPGGAPGLNTLQDLKDSLAKGNATVAGIRRMRTVLRDQFIKEGLTGSDLERRVGEVVDAAAEDVRDGLSAAGKPDAATLFAQGDAAWKTRIRTIDNTIVPLIGKDGQKSGEQIVKTLTADLQGNNARAVRFLNTLPEAEKGNVRASIIGALGRSSAGKQGSEGTDFSLNDFLTHWNKIGETAKAAYFGPEARAALNDLARVAEGAKEAQGYANMSNTGGVVANLLTIASGAGGVLTFAKTVGAQYGMGRLLASPRFARWLARAPKTALSTPAYIDRLGRIAKSEPAIANDVLALQSRLEQAFSQSPMKAAADPSDSSGNQQ